jgi:hypothetical protein
MSVCLAQGWNAWATLIHVVCLAVFLAQGWNAWVTLIQRAFAPSQALAPGADLKAQKDFVAERLSTANAAGMNTVRMFAHGDGYSFTLQPEPGGR